jgi:glycosyltransferase involved in cell wall biosynthesis
VALKHANICVIFQNPDDRTMLLNLGVTCLEQTVIIRGSGVALKEYLMLPEPSSTPTVTFASRLLKEKGVLEFVDAARILKNRGLNIKFLLVGAPDPGNPSSVSEKDILRWREQGFIEVMGFRSDVAEIFSKSNLIVFPSYYGEGLPKVLIEAAACGRPVITTDHPGCRDAIESGKTGLLVPIRDSLALANAIQFILNDSDTRMRMGRAGRELAERAFSIESVVNAHIVIYQQLLAKIQK